MFRAYSVLRRGAESRRNFPACTGKTGCGRSGVSAVQWKPGTPGQVPATTNRRFYEGLTVWGGNPGCSTGRGGPTRSARAGWSGQNGKRTGTGARDSRIAGRITRKRSTCKAKGRWSRHRPFSVPGGSSGPGVCAPTAGPPTRRRFFPLRAVSGPSRSREAARGVATSPSRNPPVTGDRRRRGHPTPACARRAPHRPPASVAPDAR